MFVIQSMPKCCVFVNGSVCVVCMGVGTVFILFSEMHSM